MYVSENKTNDVVAARRAHARHCATRRDGAPWRTRVAVRCVTGSTARLSASRELRPRRVATRPAAGMGKRKSPWNFPASRRPFEKLTTEKNISLWKKHLELVFFCGSIILFIYEIDFYEVKSMRIAPVRR